MAYFSALRPTVGRAELFAMHWLKTNNLNPGRSFAALGAMCGDVVFAYRAGSDLTVKETPPPR